MSGRFTGYLLLSDIDGTLTDERGQISDENTAAIRYFQSEGGLFTVSSGRYPTYIEMYADRFVPNTYIIGTNGTELYDPATKETVLTRPFDDRDDVRRLIHAMVAQPTVNQFSMSTYREERWISRAEFAPDGSPDPACLDALIDSVPLSWQRIIFVQPDDMTVSNMRYLESLCGDRYAIDRSWSGGIELHHKNSGKGALVPDMKRLLAEGGNPIHTVVCVGDYENDISMFRSADISYAVENAIDELKVIADRVTVHHRDHAIAKIIAELGEQSRK